jgi:hypothetical protein
LTSLIRDIKKHADIMCLNILVSDNTGKNCRLFSIDPDPTGEDFPICCRGNFKECELSRLFDHHTFLTDAFSVSLMYLAISSFSLLLFTRN